MAKKSIKRSGTRPATEEEIWRHKFSERIFLLEEKVFNLTERIDKIVDAVDKSKRVKGL